MTSKKTASEPINVNLASDGKAGDGINDNDVTNCGAAGGDVTSKLFEVLDAAGVPHLKLKGHPPSRTSDESRQVRKAASGLDTVGAKALVQKLTYRTKGTSIAIFVLPGDRKFDTKLALDRLADVKRIRFLSGDEVREATSLEIGCIPPFGKPLFPKVDHLFYDSALLDCELVGFNAASHQHSVIVKPSGLITVARPDDIFPFSVKPDAAICDEIIEGRNYPRHKQQ